jgi:hypothetical protein
VTSSAISVDSNPVVRVGNIADGSTGNPQLHITTGNISTRVDAGVATSSAIHVRNVMRAGSGYNDIYAHTGNLSSNVGAAIASGSGIYIANINTGHGGKTNVSRGNVVATADLRISVICLSALVGLSNCVTIGNVRMNGFNCGDTDAIADATKELEKMGYYLYEGVVRSEKELAALGLGTLTELSIGSKRRNI